MQKMQETWVQSLGQEDPLEKEWPPTPAFFPGEPHGQWSLAGYSLWGHTESDTAEATWHGRLHAHTLRKDLTSSTGIKLLYPGIIDQQIESWLLTLT